MYEKGIRYLGDDTMNKRSSSVDVLKGIAILLVIIGHCIGYVLPGSATVNDCINSFHMPLFFVAGGVLYKERYIKETVVRKIQTLVVPLLIYSIFNYVMRTVVGDYVENKSMIQMGGFWFIISFFFASIVFSVLDCILAKRKYKSIIIGIISACCCLYGVVWGEQGIIYMHSNVVQACVGIFFYWIGYIIKSIFFRELQQSSKWKFLACGIVFLFLCYFIKNDVSVRMYRNVYGSLVLFTVRALTGCFGMILVSLAIGKCKILEYCGRNSLIIMAIQFAVYLWTAEFVKCIWGMDVLRYFPIWVLYIVIVMIISCALAYVIDSFCPVMTGHWIVKR